MSHAGPVCMSLLTMSAPVYHVGMINSVIIRTVCQMTACQATISSAVAGLWMKISIISDTELFSKSCFHLGISFLSNCLLGLRLECHYGKWLKEKRDKSTVPCYRHNWNARPSLMHKSLVLHKILLCLWFCPKSCYSSSVLIRERRSSTVMEGAVCVSLFSPCEKKCHFLSVDIVYLFIVSFI